MTVEIRSYRTVFDLERRIYRVDRLRLNPGGIPVRGVVYCMAILTGLVLLAALPLLGAPLRALPWYLRELILPVGSAGVLTLIRVEGRPFHLAAAGLLRHAFGPHHLVGLRPCRPTCAWAERGSPGSRTASCRRWCPEELLMLPDGSDPRLRRLRYTGPGAVLVRVTHERAERRSGALSRLSGRPHLSLREPPGGLAGGAHPRLHELPGHRPGSGQVIALERGARLLVR